MLRITPSESSAAAKSYFGKALSRGDYYLKEQEVAGVWGGKGALQLGLTGEVDRDAFLGLLDNLRPDGSRLTARTVLNRRPGYDFTFDVPKSVSLMHAIGGDERIVEAMRIAVTATMRELEEEMHARVRKNDAFEDRKTGAMIWADFTHFTSRPAPMNREASAALQKTFPALRRCKDKSGRLHLPDPHLHMHVYAINATFDAVEGQWKAGEFMRVKRDASYYQAAHHSRLAAELQKLGYEIEPTAKAFEIAGVPRSTIEVFSRRTKEVEEMAKALGISDADAKAELGARTRRGKDSTLGLDELNRIWRAFLPKDEARDLMKIGATAQKSFPAPAPNSLTAAREAVRYALGRELERVSEVSERRLLAAALEQAVGRAGVSTVRSALDTTPNVLRAEVAGERRLSTVEILKEEAALMALVRGGRGSVPPLSFGPYAFITAPFREVTDANLEPRAAVEHVMGSQDWITGLIGRAGTGKTTLLQEIEAGLRANGRNLVVCAPTAEAARGVLRSDGFAQADTVKRLLTDAQMQARLRGGVLWIDEAGMLGNRDMLAVLGLAKQHGAARVVLAGDPSQIRSVPRGDGFRFLEEQAGLSVARLQTIRRQRNPALREAVEALSTGDGERGLAILAREGGIVEMDTRKGHDALAKEYAEETRQRGPRGRERSVLVVSPTHREGEAVTDAIRSHLQSVNRLGKHEESIPRTVNLSWTETEKRNAAAYEPGLVVQFKKNARGFTKSERVRVVDVEARSGLVTVRKNDGSTVPLPLDRARRFQVYRLTELKVSAGDRLRLTENVHEGRCRLDSGSFVTVEGFTDDGGVKLTTGHVLPQHCGHLTHGYAVTADSAQAKTVDTVLAAISRDSMGATDLRRVYVAVSRARDQVRIYTDDKEELFRAAERDTPRRSATELVGPERSRTIIHDIARREAERQHAATVAWSRQLHPRPTPVPPRAPAPRRGMEMSL